jgi:hypothetical protein
LARALVTGAIVALLAMCALATPTAPLVISAYDLPYTFLVERIDGSLEVSATEPTNSQEGKVVGKAQYNRSNVDIGWDYLSMEGDGRYTAGYLEGHITADMIILAGIPTMPTGQVGEWVTEHIHYMKNKSLALRDVDPFWARVGDMISYMAGMTDGLNAAKPGTNATFEQVFLISFGPELGDVQTHFQAMASTKPNEMKQNWKPSHCSALIKVTKDDLYMAHDTWDSFTGMTYRMYKVYNFYDNVVAFSSHPGFIVSTDDWYMTGRQLAIQETTNGVMNLTIFKAVLPHSVSEFLRVMAATYLSSGGEEWTYYFSVENSGTYNNQYMVVDFKRYYPGEGAIHEGTLWVAEQLPGIIVRSDESKVLNDTGYWASYNIPYFPEIFKLSGYLADYELYGDFYSYTKYARAEIFARNQTQLTTLADVMHMMRYNDYQHDPLSRIHNCSGAPNNQCQTPLTAMLSIASRGDLMPVYNTTQEMIDNYGPLYWFMAQGCFGAIDSKIAAWSNRHSLKSYVISGPSNDQQPTFTWNTGACVGTPAPPSTVNTVNYPWVEFNRVKPESKK